MDPKFQTSFIPKKPMAQTIGINVKSQSYSSSSGSGFSIYMALAIILFVVSLGAVGGAYGWKQYLINTRDDLKVELGKREKLFTVDSISELKAIDVQITLAKELLSKHLATSLIFDMISHLTIEKVRFMNLDLTTPSSASSQSDGIKISMQGVGTSLQAVAFQSDVLGQLEKYGLRNIVKNPILSNPGLDSDGKSVSFGFTASINPKSLLYSQSVTGSTEQDTGSDAGANSTGTSTGQTQ